MTHLLKARSLSIHKRALKTTAEGHLKSCETLSLTSGSFYTPNPERIADCSVKTSDDTDDVIRITPSDRKNVAVALLDYFYSTRGLQFVDAENMSKNSPQFLDGFLKKIKIEGDIKHSVTRFLRYNPVDEFEPFFESLGLKPSEYRKLIPRDKMFLNEDALFLDNHNLLRNYGVPHKSIGKIYKEATKIFGYESGVLTSKIQAYESLGLSQSFLCKVIVCSPKLLIGDTNSDFVEVLYVLKSMGFDSSWVMDNLSEDGLYSWSMINQVLGLLRGIGFSRDEMTELMKQHPTLIFENSGHSTLSLVGYQIKFSSSSSEIHSMLSKLPQIQLGKFLNSLRRFFLFFNEIGMEADEIGKIFRSHSFWLGTCNLKKTSSLLQCLGVGKRRLCQVIQENPQEMRKWVFGCKIERLANAGERIKESKRMKTKFLLGLGYTENSKEFDNAQKLFLCNGTEIRERYDFLVNLGFDEKEVREMVKACPRILSQSKELLETKLDYLVNQLGYPASGLVKCPSYLSYTTRRVKLRFSMYFWLRDKGKAVPELAMSTILACSDKYFFEKFVIRHSSGPEVWESLNKQFRSL